MEKYADNATYVMRENAHMYLTFQESVNFPKILYPQNLNKQDEK